VIVQKPLKVLRFYSGIHFCAVIGYFSYKTSLPVTKGHPAPTVAYLRQILNNHKLTVVYLSFRKFRERK